MIRFLWLAAVCVLCSGLMLAADRLIKERRTRLVAFLLVLAAVAATVGRLFGGDLLLPVGLLAEIAVISSLRLVRKAH